MNPTVTIVGIDPSFRNTGLARASYDLVTGEWQVTHLLLSETEKGKAKLVRKSSDDLSRCKIQHDAVVAFCKDAHFAVAEVPSGAQSAAAAFSNGVCCAVLAAVPCPLIEVNPTEVKLASVGDKWAAKEQMIEWAVARFPKAGWLTRKLKGNVELVAKNEHLADACAAIAAGLKTQQFLQSTAMLKAAMRIAA
jgi:Holliday junction resolvasome RuvABC endonuclease subunit